MVKVNKFLSFLAPLRAQNHSLTASQKHNKPASRTESQLHRITE